MNWTSRGKYARKKTKNLQQTAPYLRACHLQRRHRIALARGDVDKAKALLELIKRNGKVNVGGKQKHMTVKKRDATTKECITQRGRYLWRSWTCVMRLFLWSFLFAILQWQILWQHGVHGWLWVCSTSAWRDLHLSWRDWRWSWRDRDSMVVNCADKWWPANEITTLYSRYWPLSNVTVAALAQKISP